MYRIKNLSEYLSVAGLYPGEDKIIKSLTPDIIKLRNLFLIRLAKVKEKTYKNKHKKKAEVTINGRNNNPKELC